MIQRHGGKLKKYFVDKNRLPNGNHEVHSEECKSVPNEDIRIYLGEFYWCRTAVEEAKKHYFKVNGCYACCNECYRE